MNILKYRKLKNGKYQIITDASDSMELYEDVILKFNLLLTKRIENKSEILKYNEECETYYVALKYLKTRTHSKKEVSDYLKKKEYSTEYIEKAIEKLENQGYLNDLFYARSFLQNKMITTSHGPLTIKRDLQDKGISTSIILQVLEDFSLDIQKEKVEKQIQKKIQSNRNKGNRVLIRKIYHDLSHEGFEKKVIQEKLQSLQLQDDSSLAKKEYEKLYKKYCKKYSGKELEFRIKQKLYQKGFQYEEHESF